MSVPASPKPPSLPPPAALQAVERAIGDLRRGAFVVLTGPGALLIQAAEAVSKESLARLRALSRGGPQLVLSAQRARILGFCESAAGAVRIALPGGISAQAVQQMADPLTAALPKPLPEPLAILPVKPGDAGAGAVEITKLAHLLPAAVVADLPADRLSYLSAWAASEGLLITEVSEVLAYREAEGRALKIAGEARVPLGATGDCRIIAFRPPDGGREHLAIVIGDPDVNQPVLTRLHSECFTGDLLASLRCDCGDQLRGAIDEMAKQGGGILLYLAQEGRGIGLVNKLRAYRL
ncbi:MAG: GTP cyclohydrolase II, partial [Alphaproteobacteria bacterium]